LALDGYDARGIRQDCKHVAEAAPDDINLFFRRLSVAGHCLPAADVDQQKLLDQ